VPLRSSSDGYARVDLVFYSIGERFHMRSSRIRTALYRVKAAIVSTAVAAISGAGPALAAADDLTLLMPASGDLGRRSRVLRWPCRCGYTSGDKPVVVLRLCVPATADWSWDSAAAKVGHPRFVSVRRASGRC
jgi:hypothetical protein